MQASKRKAT
jgi:hypothetical protein